MRPQLLRCRSRATCLLAAALAHAVLAAVVLVRRAGADGGGALAKLDACPSADGVAPDLHALRDCEALLAQLQRPSAGQDAPCLPAAGTASQPPGTPLPECCAAALSFLHARCHCWGTTDAATVQALAAACAFQQQRLSLIESGDQQEEPGAQGVHLQAAALHAGGAAESAQRAGSLGAIKLAALAEVLHVGRQAGARPIHLGGGSAGGTHVEPGAAGGGHASAGEDVRLYLGILSAAGKREARDAIRTTWASHAQVHAYKFFLSRPAGRAAWDQLRLEAAARRDMVLLPTVGEHYFNITYQTLEACRFAAADAAATHLLKVDDDSYVRVGRLVRYLQKLPRRRLFLGYIEDPGGGPHRNTNSQWYVSQEEWPSERYPPWAHGAGYVLSADIVAEIAAGAAYEPLGGRLFKLEDISMGSWVEWVAQERNWTIHLVKDRRFNFGGCRYSDIVSHYISPAQQRCMWERHGRCSKC